MSPPQKWTPEEDVALVAEVNRRGKCWHLLKVPGRSAKQCRERYSHYLDPNLVMGDWSEADMDFLYVLSQETISPSELRPFFPGRSYSSVKYAVQRLMRRSPLAVHVQKPCVPSMHAGPARPPRFSKVEAITRPTASSVLSLTLEPGRRVRLTYATWRQMRALSSTRACLTTD